MDWSKCAAALLAALALGAAAPAAAVDLQAHRGGRCLWPENTLAAFEGALRLGVTTLELDVVLSADGVPMVLHDLRLHPDIARGPDGQWVAAPGPAVGQLTAAQLQAWDVGRLRPGSPTAQAFPQQQAADGQRIPTLAQVLALAARPGAGQVRLDIETKRDPRDPQAPDPALFARAVLDAVRAAGLLERTTLQSFDWRTLRAAQALAPQLPTACLSAQRPNFDTLRAGDAAGSPWTAGLRLADHGSAPRLVRAAGCTAWSSHHLDLSAEAVREAQALGLQVLAWTVNAPADMDRLLDWGVDGLITDRPDLAREVLARRGLPLPAPVAPR
jgi:glycerophosphoryl diester phosphodiesterase